MAWIIVLVIGLEAGVPHHAIVDSIAYDTAAQCKTALDAYAEALEKEPAGTGFCLNVKDAVSKPIGVQGVPPA